MTRNFFYKKIIKNLIILAIFLFLNDKNLYAKNAEKVPYNLCIQNTRTDCEVLHMPKLGQIESKSGNHIFTCGAVCGGDSNMKASAAAAILSPKALDLDKSHYIAFEANPENIAYFKLNKSNYERLVAIEKNNNLTLKFCQFSTDNLYQIIENYKKKYKVLAGPLILNKDTYENIKSAFKAEEDKSLCADLI